MQKLYRIIFSFCLVASMLASFPLQASWKFWEKQDEQAQETVIEEDFTPKRGDFAPDPLEEQKPHISNRPTDHTGHCPVIAQGWYFKHTSNGKQPPMPSEMQYIEQYNGYWIDKKHASMDDEEKVLYLTFDAGYENGNVEKILDILREENVPGAFFILSGLINSNTDLVKRMHDEGHLVCNHTANHKDMTKISSINEFRAELEALESLYTECTGQNMAKYYRPPEGKLNETSLQYANELGYKTILWSFAYADWDNDNQMHPEKAIEKILSETHNGEVILLHPTSATNAAILQELIHKWRDMGFRFGTLDALTEACV